MLTPDPTVVCAVETLSLSTTTSFESNRVKYYTLSNADDDLTVSVTAGAALTANDYYLRLALGNGMVFANAVTGAITGSTGVVGGAQGDSVAVYQLGEITNGASISANLTTLLAISSTEPGSYSASMSVHRDQFDAYDNVGAVASSLVGGSANVVTTVLGIDAAVTPKRGGAVADVGVGFLRFV